MVESKARLFLPDGYRMSSQFQWENSVDILPSGRVSLRNVAQRTISSQRREYGRILKCPPGKREGSVGTIAGKHHPGGLFIRRGQEVSGQPRKYGRVLNAGRRAQSRETRIEDDLDYR